MFLPPGLPHRPPTFAEGADIVDKVIVGSAPWSDLFAKHDFFHKYRYYLQVIASTGNPDLQIKWYADLSTRVQYAHSTYSYIGRVLLNLEYVNLS